MKKLSLLALAFAFTACKSTAVAPEFGSASGSLALSKGGDLLYVAESDTNALVVIETRTMTQIGRVPVGEMPERVTVGPDDRIFVSNRMARSVSVIEKGNWEAPVNEIGVGAEPTGLSVSPDGKTLAVANSASGTVSIVNLETLDVREAPVGQSVAGVRFVDKDKVYATIFKGGKVVAVNTTTATPMGAIDLTQQLNLNNGFGGEKDCFDCSFAPSMMMDKRTANLVPDVILSPSGDRVYVPHVLAKSDPVPTEQPGGYSGEGGAMVPAVAAAITTIDPATDAVKPQVATAATREDMVPPAIFRAEGEPMAAPVAAALDPRGDWLFIANQNSGNVAIVSTGAKNVPQSSQGIFAFVKVGAGPKGIAVSPDGMTAYVHNAFDYTVSVLRAAADGSALVVDDTVKIVDASPVPDAVQRGRKLFHDASDTKMTNPRTGGIACASCHPGGRDDGRTWELTTQGMRNTPSLAGRHLAETKPYHWDGEFNEFNAFQKIVQERMGGSGASEQDFADILAYLDSKWNPGPDNPNRTPDGSLNEAQARGRIVFEGKASCGSCHTGTVMTDNKFYDASRFSARAGQDTLVNMKVNTPTLSGIFFSGPYLHDGTAATLEARVGNDMNGNHGKTAGLTAGERSDLVEYLKTL